MYGGLLSLCNFTSLHEVHKYIGLFNSSILPSGEKDTGILFHLIQPTFASVIAVNTTALKWSSQEDFIMAKTFRCLQLQLISQTLQFLYTLILGDVRSGRDQDSYASETMHRL